MRIVIAHINGHYALHSIWVQRCIFITKNTAPIVQDQGDGFVRADSTHHFMDEAHHLNQGFGLHGCLSIKCGQCKTHALVSVTQRLYGVIPKG